MVMLVFSFCFLMKKIVHFKINLIEIVIAIFCVINLFVINNENKSFKNIMSKQNLKKMKRNKSNFKIIIDLINNVTKKNIKYIEKCLGHPSINMINFSSYDFCCVFIRNIQVTVGFFSIYFKFILFSKLY